MYRCKDCNAVFEFPEEKNIDAGHGVGILGFPVAKTIKFCPACMSTKLIKYATGGFIPPSKAV